MSVLCLQLVSAAVFAQVGQHFFPITRHPHSRADWQVIILHNTNSLCKENTHSLYQLVWIALSVSYYSLYILKNKARLCCCFYPFCRWCCIGRDGLQAGCAAMTDWTDCWSSAMSITCRLRALLMVILVACILHKI